MKKGADDIKEEGISTKSVGNRKGNKITLKAILRFLAADPSPESTGLEAIAEGFKQIAKDDFDNISKQFYVYDALYAYCNSKLARQKKRL